MGPVAGIVVGGVVDLVKGWIQRKFPDPEEQKKAQMEFEQFLAAKDQQEVAQFYDFVTKYEGEGDKVAPELQIYRGSVRPTITYALVIGYVWGILQNWPQEYMTNLYNLNLISLGFWYGERALKNLGLNIGNPFGKK